MRSMFVHVGKFRSAVAMVLPSFQQALVIAGLGVLAGFPVGITRSAAGTPSFNCADAGTAVELAICASDELSFLDRQLAETYGLTSAGLGADGRQRLLQSQRMWLAQRDQCGSNHACLSQLMRSRIAELVQYTPRANPGASASLGPLIDGYSAIITDQDRRNSRGLRLTKVSDILTQDRANYHRFGIRHPGETADSYFADRDHRADFGRLVANGTVTPEARDAILRDPEATIVVEVYGRSPRADRVAVTLEPRGQSPAGLAGSQATPPAAMIGDNGPVTDEDILFAQSFLAQKDFYSGRIDGDFGPGSHRALADYRASVGLSDGAQLNSGDIAAMRGVGVASRAAASAAGDMSSGSETTLSALSGRPPSGDGATPSGTSMGTDELVRIDGLPVWGAAVNRLKLPASADQLEAHEAQFSRRLIYTAWLEGTDDLGASLRDEHLSNVRAYYDISPENARAEIDKIGLSLNLSNVDTASSCINRARGSNFRCIERELETEFDRRRFAQGVSEVISREVPSLAFDTPIDVFVTCNLRQIDTEYDLDSGLVNWESLTQTGDCRNPNSPMEYLKSISRRYEYDYRLGEGMPVSSPMDPSVVEDLARRTLPVREGNERYFPTLMLTFHGQISMERITDARNANASNPIHPVLFRFTRSGPIELRLSSEPLIPIMQFGSDPQAAPASEALDITDADVLAGVIRSSEPLEFEKLASFYGEVFSEGNAGAGEPVKLPAYVDMDDAGHPHLRLRHFGREGQTGRIAMLAQAPESYFGWDQVLGKSNGPTDADYIENPELIFALPRMLDDTRSERLDAAAASAAKNGEVYLVGRMIRRYRTGGEINAALLAFVQPEYFEVRDSVFDHTSKVMARFPLADVEQADLVRMFVPSPYWLILREAQLTGTDPREVIEAAFEKAKIFKDDTFARLDAIDAALEAGQTIQQANQGGETWLVGTLSLEPYDLDAEAYPVSFETTQVPIIDDVERHLERRVMPDLRRVDFVLPVDVEQARALRDRLNSSQKYPFRARIDYEADPEGGLDARIRSISILPPQGSGSRKMEVPAAFVPGDEIITVTIPDTVPELVAEGTPVASAQPENSVPDTQPAAVQDILGLQIGMDVQAFLDTAAERLPDGVRFRSAPVAKPGLYSEAVAVTRPDGDETLLAVTRTVPEGTRVLALMQHKAFGIGEATVPAVKKALIAKYGAHGREESGGRELYWGAVSREIDGYGVCGGVRHFLGSEAPNAQPDAENTAQAGMGMTRPNAWRDLGWPTGTDVPEPFLNKALPYCGPVVSAKIRDIGGGRLDLIVWLHDLTYAKEMAERAVPESVELDLDL